MMRRACWQVILAAVVLILSGAVPPESGKDNDDDRDDGTFNFSPPVACKEIYGYEDYIPLPKATLTADEKLIVYFRPRHFKSVQKGSEYEVHFTQDAQIRRRGEKTAVVLKIHSLEFQTIYPQPPEHIYLLNRIALKGLKPGDYDLEMVLHDAIGKPKPAVRILPFTVVAPAVSEEPVEKTDKPAAP